jgi:1-pyrroline-5-carboxylate dehydrogenase
VWVYAITELVTLWTILLQVITEYKDSEVAHVLEACERMEQHLTAAVVSNDVRFVNHVLANTLNGTTYAGIRARTTGTHGGF